MGTSLNSGAEKILIADEDPEVLDSLARQTLLPMGYQVATAADGPTAIQRIVTFHPDVVIASLTLPRLTAKDVLVTLRAQGLEAPVIVTAPVGMESMALRAFRLGARDYLSKPLREAGFAPIAFNTSSTFCHSSRRRSIVAYALLARHGPSTRRRGEDSGP